MLCRGTHIVETMLPGGRALAQQLGAQVTTPGRWKTSFKGRWTHYPEGSIGLDSLMGSRALIEESIRARLLTLCPNVRIRCREQAAAPIWSGNGTCMQGVVTSDGDEVWADLVVDAAGRRSPLPGWLAAGGYQLPKVVEVDPHVTYTSRLYRQTAQVAEDRSWDTIYVRANAPCTRGGLLQKIENNLLLCCVWGYSGGCPPNDEQGFQDFVATLEKPDIYEVLSRLHPALGSSPHWLQSI